MLNRILGPLVVATLVLTTGAVAQATPTRVKEPSSNGRTLSQWIVDLKAASPQIRNAAAYEIAGMGPAAVRAVPALIQTLDDSEPVVRFPATVALGEIGPGAKAAVPRLRQMIDAEINDEIAASARRALKRIEPAAVPTE